MAIELVRKYLKKYDKDGNIVEFDVSSATVALAAKALGIDGQRIAKTLSFHGLDGPILIVAAGDAKIDNKQFKQTFGLKAKMLKPEEVVEATNHEVGGVCPFGIPSTTKVYLDESLKRFQSVFPACGSSNSAIELTIDELEQITHYESWVMVTKDWQKENYNENRISSRFNIECTEGVRKFL